VLLGVLLCERLTGLLGSPVSRRDLDLSAGPCGLSSSAVHLRLAPGASSSRELSASSRVLRPATCPPCLEIVLRPPLDRRAPPMGSSPSSRHQPAASTTPQGIPTPRSSSLLDVSHVLEGLLRHQPSRACFIPLPRPGFALQGIVPHRGAVPGFPGRFMPSCR